MHVTMESSPEKMEPKYLTEMRNFRDLENRYPSLTSEKLSISIPSTKLSYFSEEQSIDAAPQVELPTSVSYDTSGGYPKKEFKKLTWGQDSYEGMVLSNNLHGSGFYLTQRNGQKYFYDGLFYINKLEGYCQIFYENGTHFQGLFKDHIRHGPGILTYPNNSQDVGFWSGFKLIRLVSVVDYEAVPSLASTHIGKTKLLCSRYLVPLCKENDYIMKNTLENIGASEETVDNLDAILNINIRNPNSFFFHKHFYDEQFFGGQDCTIKVFIDPQEYTDSLAQDENYDALSNTTVERAEHLRSKIQEVDDSLQTFVAIKQNMSRRVHRCKTCCARADLMELYEASEEYIPDIAEKTTPEREFIEFDPSLGSYELAETFVNPEVADEEFSEPAIPDLLEDTYVCTCEDSDEYSGGLRLLEEQLENVSRQETYYRNIRDELQKKLNRIEEREATTCSDIKFKLVKVKELWAWNNEDSLVQIQKHCFKHRNSEDMVNFSVCDLILGNRKEFGKKGKHEDMCQKYLQACGKGHVDFLKECLRSESVHPNVADAKGNTGIFFAAARNQNDTILVLRNYGLKLDQLNDEQLTPLSMCLLKYIALKNNSGDWEIAFLPEKKNVRNLPDLPKWYDIKSFITITSSKESSDPDQEEISQYRSSNVKYVFLNRKVSSAKPRKPSVPRASFNPRYVFDLSCDYPQENAPEEESRSVEDELGCIYASIMTLLNCGASPNSCDVPYPPLVLALFTEKPDLVKEVIKANADINVLSDDHMSCLHIVASLRPCLSNVNICMVLVKYGCNPNHKTLPRHWVEKRPNFVGTLPENFEIEDVGKNPLHLLCMRTDFEGDQSDYFCSVAKLLLETNIDTSSTYLGHTPLSLAVLSGNIKLAQYFIRTNVFDPYKILQYGMGNILTLYSLQRFENTLHIDQRKAMLTALFEININVLNKVGDVENAIVFAENGDKFFEQFIQEEPTKTGGKDKNKPKPKKTEKHSQGIATIVEFMKGLGRQTIIKQIQMGLVDVFYELVEEDMLGDSELFAILASEYLTPQIVVENLLHLFQSRRLDHDRLDSNTIKTLLEFVNLHKIVSKKAAPKILKKEKDSKEPKRGSEENMETMANEFSKTFNSKYAQPTRFVIAPGLDDPLKYKICYHCLRGRGQQLKSCPRCQMIQFCSSQCNKLNLKLKTQHGCNILFYDMSEEQITDISKGLCLNELVQVVREKCVARWQKIREAKLAQEEKRLLEIWRADTYGTKFLKMKPLFGRILTENKGKELKLNIGLLKTMLERTFQKCPGEVSLYSLENLLMKLQGIKRSEGTLRTKHSYSTKRSTLGGSTLHSVIFDMYDIQESTSKTCICSEKGRHMKAKAKDKSDGKKKPDSDKRDTPQLISYMNDEHVNKFEELVGKYPVQEKSKPVTKKLKRIPDRYQKFIEVIGTHFPDIDVSFWLLPYACCSDGQLYYRFCDNDIFKESYSFS